ncbi:MAG: hypothetical protein NUV74_05490 [Candidatus Brocadiaceae bacterium]|nr:hypothetical protein [Candidatus Brocadiaceae bacterium]
MTDTKRCAYCPRIIVREDNATDFNWRVKKYCSSLCKCSAANDARRPKRDKLKINDHVRREAQLDGLSTRKLQSLLTRSWNG